MKLQRLYSCVRKAMEEYDMVSEGDKIAIGISGGKDSLTLLYALAGLRNFYPKKFELVAITVDLGYGDFNLSQIAELCDRLSVEYHVVKTRIGEIVSGGEENGRSEENGRGEESGRSEESGRGEEGRRGKSEVDCENSSVGKKDGKSRCSLCARLRKGALNDKAIELGCNSVALAHNMDDAVETMLMSLIYEGRISTFWAVTRFDDCDLKVIRPLVKVPLEDVIGFKNKYELPVTKNPCPYDGITGRTRVRELLSEINRMAPGARDRMMTAISELLRGENEEQD